ncbi:MAG: hypothetical protein P8Q42_07145 [Flavobacteriales bacterium]|nr:hypothetical protein [Flavobacteriales bacterium]|tara:strand:- start:236 stop:373 length:138 start_codon:yes stop_codon:yes gene_type:complete
MKLNQTEINGGFTDLDEAPFGVFTPEIIHILNEINAVASANIVSN